MLAAVSMLQWPRNRRESWVFVRRLLALVVVFAGAAFLCGLCVWGGIRQLN